MKTHGWIYLCVLLSGLAVLTAVNWGIAKAGLPAYATWTGISTLEIKLDRLDAFAGKGPVDTVLIGSSISDFGVSAEALSSEMTRLAGKPYRAFNFSTGGAEPTTWPALYRFLRTSLKPKRLLVFPPVEHNLGETLAAPDKVLLQSPVAATLNNSYLLGLSRRLWQLPMVRFASPVRDLVMYGGFANRTATHADLFPISEYGDSISFRVTAPQAWSKDARNRREHVLLMSGQYLRAPDAESKRKVYLSDMYVQALTELRRLAGADGVLVTVVDHDQAGALSITDSGYRAGQQPFYDVLAQVFPVPQVRVARDFHAKPFEISDSVHLNQHGARRFARLVAAELAKATSEKGPLWQTPDLAIATAAQNEFVLSKHATEPAGTLELQLFESWQFPAMPLGSKATLVLKTPSHTELTSYARLVRHGVLAADVPPLAAGDMVLLASVAPSGQSSGRIPVALAGYRWLPQRHSAEYYGRAFLTAEVKPGVILARWKGIEEAHPQDWVGIFPAGGPETSRLSITFTRGQSSGQSDLPIVPPGEYELRLYARGGWDRLAVSNRFQVKGNIWNLLSTPAGVQAGAALKVEWHNVEAPDKGDWIGLFPKGGGSQPRVAAIFTSGLASGTQMMPVPASTPPGQYELRFFPRNTWSALSVSKPFRILRPPRH